MTGVETIIEDAAWEAALDDAPGLAARCHEAAAAAAPALAGAAALLLTDDATLRDLNRRFRRIDRPTNVLSFPSGEEAPGFLGDIAIAYETCAREAREKGVGLADHTAHLIIHGLLHLAGHDHMEDAEAETMETLETAILASIGVADPYRLEET